MDVGYTMEKVILAIVLVNLVVIKSTGGHELLLDFLEFPSQYPEVKLSEKCLESLNKLNLAIKSEEDWAVQIRDASGKSSSGFVWGNSFWLGHRKYCSLIEAPKVKVDYRMFYATHTSPVQFNLKLLTFIGLHVGLCFPRDCQEIEIFEMAKIIFQSEVFQKPKFYGEVTFMKTKKLKLRDNFYDDPFTRLLR